MEVFISQWAKEAAHNLDMRREAWESRKSTVNFVSQELRFIRVDSSLNHERVLSSSYEDILELYNDVKHDIRLLQSYISTLNATKQIDGRFYPKAVFSAYRQRVINEMQYKQLLSSLIKEKLTYYRMFVSDFQNPKLQEVFGDKANSENDDLFNLYLLFKRKMKEAYGKEFGKLFSEEEQAFLDYIQLKTHNNRKAILERV